MTVPDFFSHVQVADWARERTVRQSIVQLPAWRSGLNSNGYIGHFAKVLAVAVAFVHEVASFASRNIKLRYLLLLQFYLLLREPHFLLH